MHRDQVPGTSPLVGVIGDNTIDHYVGADERRLIGGNALNVAVQLSHAGCRVRLATAVAEDEAGMLVRRALVENGIPITGVAVLDGVTSVSRIRVAADGDRHFEHEEFGVCDDYRPSAETLAWLAECDVVHVGMLREADVVRRALSEVGVAVTQDCAVTPGASDLAVAFDSAGDDPRRAEAMAQAAIAEGARLAVVTMGSRGSLAFDGTSWWRQDAVPVDVVDTTGAGDSFIAGFIAARLLGASIAEAMRGGAERAATTCTHLGGWQHDRGGGLSSGTQ